jgi:hypothetical protein
MGRMMVDMVAAGDMGRERAVAVVCSYLECIEPISCRSNGLGERSTALSLTWRCPAEGGRSEGIMTSAVVRIMYTGENIPQHGLTADSPF